MALNLPTFYKRTGSAIVFGIIMLAGLLWNIWAFVALVSVINVLCLREYFRLMQQIDKDKDTYWPAWLQVAIVFCSLIFVLLFCNFYDGIEPVAGILARLLPIIPAILLLAAALQKKTALKALLQGTFGLLYITLPIVLLISMRVQDMVLPIALILMIWTNDTMAYLVGSFIGKTPFSPISPKKTWEGTAGGALLTIIGAGIYGYCSHTYRLIDWIMIALCAAVAGTLGDLLESKLKRLADVKDSGTMMPGHGGALDRFDSLLVAAPFAYAYTHYFM